MRVDHRRRKKPWWNIRENRIERVEFEGTVKLKLEVGLEIVIGMKIGWRVEDLDGHKIAESDAEILRHITLYKFDLIVKIEAELKGN